MSPPRVSHILSLLAAAAVLLAASRAAHAAGSFQTGWWAEITEEAKLAGYAAEGDTLVLMDGGGWYADDWGRPSIQAYLDEAQKYGIRVIVSMTHSNHTPDGVDPADFAATINAFKNHPALYGWYLGDEPELFDNHDADPGDDWQIPYGYLAAAPGYYGLAKAADPDHPVLISFNTIYNPYDTYWARIANFMDVTDAVGMHSYPFWTPNPAEFSGGDARAQYDVWKYALEHTLATGRNPSDFIATCQGFGTNPYDSIYRDPTDAELRYQVFTAVVLGIGKVLFWYDGWANAAMLNRVAQMTAQIQHIGAEMNAGVTNDPAVEVSITDRNQLVYRYGSAGTRHVILAVNIANRDSASGQTLPDVGFKLPPGVLAKVVTVLEESRTLPVSNGYFYDSFSKFQVHAYAFGGAPPAAPRNLRKK